MLNQLSKTQSFSETNKKLIYKLEKMKNAPVIYFCECGKDYLSFPALYLHARTKHQVKLTTKMSQEVCRIQKGEKCDKITYYLGVKGGVSNQQEENQGEEMLEKEQNSEIQFLNSIETEISIQSAVLNYLNQNNISRNSNKRKILERLLEFIEKYHSSQAGPDSYCSMISAKHIPLYFNQFVSMLQTIQSDCQVFSNIKDICNNLFQFSNWLRVKNLTELQVDYQPNWQY